MSENLSQLFTEQFTTNLQLRLQQMSSMLRGKCDEGFHVGKMASPINQVGAVSMKAPAGRFAPKNRTDADFTRRWVTPAPMEMDQLIDSFDELETIVDPKSKYVENAAAAAGRVWDDQIIAAAFGSAQIGVDIAGLSTETFDTTKFQIAHDYGASATTGLTSAKLIESRRILRHYHNDLDAEEAYAVIGSQQESDLLKQAQVTSSDFNQSGGVLENGRVRRWIGFDFVVSERLAVSSNDRKCIVYVKSGMYLGMWKDLTNRVSIRNDLSGEPYDLYTSTMSGATRTQPGKVIQVLCNDTTGSDITP